MRPRVVGRALTSYQLAAARTDAHARVEDAEAAIERADDAVRLASDVVASPSPPPSDVMDLERKVRS